MVCRHEGSCCRHMLKRHVPATRRCVVHTGATCIRVGSRSWGMYQGQSHNICTLMKMLRVQFQGYVAATCQVELHGTRREDKITPKLVLHNYKSISSHEGTRRCNISLKHVPATPSSVCACCDFVPATRPGYTSLLHVASVCTTQVFCRCNMSLQHEPSCLPIFKMRWRIKT